MALEPKDVAKWSREKWKAQIKMLRPSGGGAQGVMFAFTKDVKGFPIPQADFVVKPIETSAANTQFAEKVLKKVVGAQTLGSVGVGRNTPLGYEIMATIDRLIWEHRNGKRFHQDSTRLVEVRNFYDRAEAFLLQSLAAGMSELGDVAREENGLVSVLRNAKLMKNLGRLYVADAVLGNGDRLDNLNAGNIAFDKKSGSIFAIDSTTVLSSFEQLLKDATMDGAQSERFRVDPGQAKLDPSMWGQEVFGQGGVAAPTNRTLGAKGATTPLPAARMDLLFDPPKIFERFQKNMGYSLSNENDRLAREGKPLLPLPSPEDWVAGKQPFVDGVLSGLKRVDTMLAGLGWLRTKSGFNALQKKHGADPNMDWTNFKLRRVIARQARNGGSASAAKESAMDYVRKKFGAF